MTHVDPPPPPPAIRPLPQAKERTSEVHQATQLTTTEHISGLVPLESWCTAALKLQVQDTVPHNSPYEALQGLYCSSALCGQTQES